MKKKVLILTLVAIGMAIAASSAGFDLNPKNWFMRSISSGNDSSLINLASPVPVFVAPLPPGITPNYRAIAQQAGPAVVGVTVSGLHGLGPDDMALHQNDPFFLFFRGIPGFQWHLPGQGSGSIPFRGQGSGFIISHDGIILTNAHVVRDAKEVMVKLGDRREFKAKVLGADSVTDVAVLRIAANNLPAVRLGDAFQLQVGDPVLAIGSPYGLEQTATQGIVSALGRSLPGDATVPFIQTDAAVNPGNSGGPLFDATGAVVGINAQIYSQSGGYQGLSFAIPINVALRVKQQIISTGHASHARLGVLVQEVSQALAEAFGLPRPEGALIVSVMADSPAAAVGLAAGDIVSEVNGQTISSSGDLSSRIALATPGEKMHLKLWHKKSLREIDVKLGRTEPQVSAPVRRVPEVKTGQLGLMLRPLMPEELQGSRLSGGLLIEAAAGTAERAGLQAGDILLSINEVPVNSTKQLNDIMSKKPKYVALLIQRGNERSFVPLEFN